MGCCWSAGSDVLTDNSGGVFPSIVLWSAEARFGQRRKNIRSVARTEELRVSVDVGSAFNFLELPFDVQFEVLGNLNPQDLCRFAQVNKDCKLLADSDFLWKRLLASQGLLSAYSEKADSSPKNYLRSIAMVPDSFICGNWVFFFEYGYVNIVNTVISQGVVFRLSLRSDDLLVQTLSATYQLNREDGAAISTFSHHGAAGELFELDTGSTPPWTSLSNGPPKGLSRFSYGLWNVAVYRDGHAGEAPEIVIGCKKHGISLALRLDSNGYVYMTKDGTTSILWSNDNCGVD